MSNEHHARRRLPPRAPARKHAAPRLATAARGLARRLGAVLLAAGLLLAWQAPARADAPLRVGGKNFTEQLILSSMTAQYLRAKGYATDLTTGLGSTLMRQALENGQLDVVWDYTGTALVVFNHVQEKLNAEQSYERVKTLDAKKGLVWLRASTVNNTYALAMPHERAEATGITTLSQYAKMVRDTPEKRHPFAVDMEFAARPDGLEPLKKAYDLPLTRRDIIQLDPGLVYTALRNNQVDTGLVYTTDGRVKGFGLVLLRDDLNYFPAYNAAPVVREEILRAHPKLAEQLNALAAQLDNAAMTEMNYQVDIGQRPVDQVATDFLRQHGLI
ncbi:glycine/betaine ABC transporter substrate-binding protein [Bordetella genomosp. 10]|uniref:Glycine/betaine ABC transporter substrate-binding protein n=1 Tax=Bordetella genomosp. 10 TaxID=1416804 RepID=A0A261RZH4_9BORD|nr:glycine betaine ABC transporter substrate-binding protein [Bordetella genomosp. 10]OZI30052.1 glycine/betaine ABC transporter substrate-binding protein [Bordetella genomosp. 10]